MNKMIKCRIIEVIFPTDGRRKATLITQDKEFCESMASMSAELESVSDIRLINKERIKGVIDKLQPQIVSEVFDKESINDKRKTYAYWLALDDLKKELGLI